MKTFWKFLLRKSLPADSLKALHVAVFGLGDSGELCMLSTLGFSFQKLGCPGDTFFLLAKACKITMIRHENVILESARLAGYQNYNTVAKKLDRRVQALGASAICERGLGDDQHPNGYEAGLDPWLRKLWSELSSCCPLPEGLSEVCSCLLTHKMRVHWHAIV